MQQPYVSLSHTAAGTSSVMFTAIFYFVGFRDCKHPCMIVTLLHPISRVEYQKWIFESKIMITQFQIYKASV